MDNKELKEESRKVSLEIESRLKDLVPSASGKLKDSIKAVVDDKGLLIDIQIEGESYFKYVDEGRLAGTFPNLSDIQNWVKEKGIEPKAAFAIALTIEKRGIQPRNISEKFSNTSIIDDSASKLEQAFAIDVETELRTLINKIFK